MEVETLWEDQKIGFVEPQHWLTNRMIVLASLLIEGLILLSSKLLASVATPKHGKEAWRMVNQLLLVIVSMLDCELASV